MSGGPATLAGVELDTALAAKWCSKHEIPELSPEALAGLSELSRILRHSAAGSQGLLPVDEVHPARGR